jgi:hypothetical protein
LVLLLSSSALSSCARADDSGIDGSANGGTANCTVNCTGGTGGTGGSGGSSGFDAGLDLCGAVCAKLSAATNCHADCGPSVAACSQFIQSTCGAEWTAFFQCYAFVGNLNEDCSDVTGCEAEKQNITLCQPDSCPQAKNGQCDEPDPCPVGTDFTDCGQ